MKFLSLLIVVLLVFCLVLMGCQQAAPEPTGPSRLTIASGWVTGVYYLISGAMSRIAYLNMPNISLSVESSGTCVANVMLIGSGDNDLAIVQNDIAFYYYNGQLMFEDEKVENIRGGFMLYPEPCQLVVAADSGINSPADLAGKRVAVGPLGSGSEANALQIVEAYGLTFADFASTKWTTAGEAVKFLKDGGIDAAFFTTGVGASVIADLAIVKDVKLVVIDDEHAAKLAAEYPFYSTTVIPAGVYNNVPDTQTIAVLAMMVARAELSEEVMYEFTKAIFENLGTIHESHAMGKQVTLESALDGMPIELHPGAEKYFKEAGIM